MHDRSALVSAAAMRARCLPLFERYQRLLGGSIPDLRGRFRDSYEQLRSYKHVTDYAADVRREIRNAGIAEEQVMP